MCVEPSDDVWTLGHLEVGASPIAGRGLFAGEPIQAGELVFRLGGRLVATAHLDALIRQANLDGRYVDTITVFDDRHLVLPEGMACHFANHSCDPNLWHDGPYDVRARRDIPAGDELTIDYGTNSGAPGFEMPCACGARGCRELVTSDDWRLAELQHRYQGHWVPALAHRIAGLHTT